MTSDALSAAIAHTIVGRATAWCGDADTRDNVLARRNLLVGLWAGRLMQIPSHMLQSYSAAVNQANSCRRGDEDVIDKLFGDLTRCGTAITREEVRCKLSECHRLAFMQTRETD
jgi:hypothetical protein